MQLKLTVLLRTKWKAQLDKSALSGQALSKDIAIELDTNSAQQIRIAPYSCVTVSEVSTTFHTQLSARVEIIIGAYAQVRYQLNPLHDKTIESIVRDLTFVLEGERAMIECVGALGVYGTCSQELRIRQVHHAPNTTSLSSIRMVLDDYVRVVYQGNVYIDPIAQGAHATQDYKALVLADTVQVSAQPELEILHNNVACRHGVAIGQLNKDHFFYGMSRGIGESKLKKILIEAFLK